MSGHERGRLATLAEAVEDADFAGLRREIEVLLAADDLVPALLAARYRLDRLARQCTGLPLGTV